MRVSTSSWCRFLVTAAVLVAHADGAAASTISLGIRIPIDARTFALPIDITGAEDVSSWTLDLTYDPTDVQVNSACDPFSGDVYCSFLTGPVTEGDVFASGAPFNVLTPGFILLDGVGAQIGQLLAVTDTYGGPPPSPTGDGVLAYVEFTQVGTGDGSIVVNGNANSDVLVPEPATLVLVTAGALAYMRRRRR